MAKTARIKTTWRVTSANWRIFAELDKPKRTLSKINLTSMQVLKKHVLAMLLN